MENKTLEKTSLLTDIFFILGFADDNQQLFIYDKIRNEILEVKI
jgi:hypothetical protein